MNALSKLLVISFTVLSTKIYADSIDQTFERLRSLSDSMRITEFSKLGVDSKKELFFIANEREPPYTGFDEAIAQQGIIFFLQLRAELKNRGGTPEVLDFLTIANQMKNRGLLNPKDIESLNLDNICALAPISNYCPILLEDLMNR